MPDSIVGEEGNVHNGGSDAEHTHPTQNQRAVQQQQAEVQQPAVAIPDNIQPGTTICVCLRFDYGCLMNL